MEFEEVRINLCAIRLLYRLLEDNSLHDANLENVVERARVLLKSLLDVAVELVFEAHLKVTATEAGTKSETMQETLVKMTNQSNDKVILHNIESDNHEHQQMFDAKAAKSNEEGKIQLRNDIYEAECNSIASRLVESVEQNDDFADDLVNAIKRIESRILAFQLSSNLMDATKNGALHHPLHKASNLESPEIQRKNRAARSHLCCRKSLLERHRLVNQKTDQSSRKGENTISANAFEKPFITRNDESAKSVYIPKHISTQMPAKSTAGRREKAPQPRPHHMVIKPTLLDQRSSEIRVNSHRHRDRSVLDRRGTHKTQPREPEESSSTPNSSSQWTSQQGSSANSSNSDSEDSSLAVRTQDPTSRWIVNAAYEGTSQESSNSTESPTPRWIANAAYEESSEESSSSYLYKDDIPSHRAGSFKSYRHNGQRSPKKTNERLKKRVAYEGSSKESSNSTQAPSSRWIANASYQQSSEESSSNSYLYKDNSPSHRAESFKSYRHNSQRSPKRKYGTLKGLKNKLGLIFHHQHHHHHHHHDEGHGHSMWNVFHHKNKHEMLTDKKVEKTRRRAITKVLPRSNQVGQFHRLVEGLVTHIKHSKKPKPSKHDGRVKGSRITPHGQKNLHWWKILRRHRAAKLKNRDRVIMRL